MRFHGATLARNLPQALKIYADILRKPHLPYEELDAVKALALQDILSLEDEPQRKTFLELRKRHFPPPLSNDYRGTEAGINSLTIDCVRDYFRRHVQAQGTILSVAGNVEWQPLCDLVGDLFGDWNAGEDSPLQLGQVPERRLHMTKDTAQTQITLAYPSVPFGHPEYYAALGAVNVLSGGMSARLFTEVREKRGLCYEVGASYSTFKDRGSVFCYTAAVDELAQQAFDVTVAELRRLAEGVEPEEVERLQVGLKTSLVMAEESTGSRAGTLASDWYYLGRIRTFDEILTAVNSLTPEAIVEHVRRYPPRDFSIVTLGRQALNLDAA
jgi:predicted Zn-dependent peptidase